MSAMKRFCENVSVQMGKGGVIDDEVLAEAERRFKRHSKGYRFAVTPDGKYLTLYKETGRINIWNGNEFVSEPPQVHGQ